MTVREWVAERAPEARVLEEKYDEAILGMACGARLGGVDVVAYSADKLVHILMDEIEGETDEDRLTDAIDYFEVNIAGAYMGEYTPVFVDRWHG